MPIMIWLAALVEAAIQNWTDMAILLFIQFANASIGFYEVSKAGDAVAALKNQLQVIQHTSMNIRIEYLFYANQHMRLQVLVCFLALLFHYIRLEIIELGLITKAVHCDIHMMMGRIVTN